MTIFTASMDQHAILDAIRKLYLGGQQFHADLTFGNGVFYPRMSDLPEIRADLDSSLTGLTHPGVDVRALPFDSSSLRSVVFDPPFIHAAGEDSIIGNRFGSYPSQWHLSLLYRDAALSISDVLAPGGILVWKCQDIVESGKQVWNHIAVMGFATMAGLAPVDLFILMRRGQVIGHNHGKQQHARRNHSYFWVFSKA